MNSFILMAEIIQDPQLRYTSENQSQIAEMLVQFPGSRPEDPPATLKVVGWGNLAQEIHQQYHQGDRVIIEGRLSMNTIDRKEGFKEKRAELVAQRVYSLAGNTLSSPTPRSAPETTSYQPPAPSTAPSNVVPLGARNRPSSTSDPTGNRAGSPTEWESSSSGRQSPPPPPPEPSPSNDFDSPDYDPIPF